MAEVKINLTIVNELGDSMVDIRYQNPWPFIPRVRDRLALARLESVEEYEGNWADYAEVESVEYDAQIADDAIYVSAVAMTNSP